MVSISSDISRSSACFRSAPHISPDACKPAQNPGRSGRRNIAQRISAVRFTHATPADLPFGMPGRGLVMEGAMQQAPQWGRQFVMPGV
jgi:hypothetical protein